MKSVPFRAVLKVPRNIEEGTELKFPAGKGKVSKIKSIKFLDMRTMEVIGLCKPMREETE